MAGWIELRLPALVLVVFVGMLPGIYDAVVNYSVYSDKRACDICDFKNMKSCEF